MIYKYYAIYLNNKVTSPNAINNRLVNILIVLSGSFSAIFLPKNRFNPIAIASADTDPKNTNNGSLKLAANIPEAICDLSPISLIVISMKDASIAPNGKFNFAFFFSSFFLGKYFFSKPHKPNAMNDIPITNDKIFDGKVITEYAPINIAIPSMNACAVNAPAKTRHGFLYFMPKAKITSCVLSAISDKNTTNIEVKNASSIPIL